MGALGRLGFDVLPSGANFVFVRHPKHEGQALAAALRARAVLVRHFAGPRVSDYIRVSVGSRQDIDRLIEALGQTLSPR